MPGGEQDFEARLLPLWEGHLMAVIRNITERKQAEKQLMATTERLRALSARITRAREEERTNIAREVHDELGQLLTALRMDVFWLDKRLPAGEGEDQVRIKLEEMIELIDVSISTVRRISRELRPGVLDELGLAEALRWQLQSFHYRTGIEYTFTSTDQELVVDHARSTALFRIFQEALTNITRHAHATEVRVDLTCEPDNLLLEIADNGVGMLGESVNHMESLGILGMKERANIFGGEVSVSGEKGRGTTVKVSIPLA
jgi:signal transduction histidine kinase